MNTRLVLFLVFLLVLAVAVACLVRGLTLGIDDLNNYLDGMGVSA